MAKAFEDQRTFKRAQLLLLVVAMASSFTKAQDVQEFEFTPYTSKYDHML
jgi:hypothetical protein